MAAYSAFAFLSLLAILGNSIVLSNARSDNMGFTSLAEGEEAAAVGLEFGRSENGRHETRPWGFDGLGRKGRLGRPGDCHHHKRHGPSFGGHFEDMNGHMGHDTFPFFPQSSDPHTFNRPFFMDEEQPLKHEEAPGWTMWFKNLLPGF
eukprot:Gb_03564 [translate_table: standard]